MKPDIIVLATGDADFVTLIQEVRKSGVRVEVAAFPETAGRDILLKCSGFIDMAVYYQGYLAAQNGDSGEDGVDAQFKDLIQLQESELNENDEDDEDGGEDEEKDVPDVTVPADAAGDDITVPVTDTIDDPGL